MVRITFSLFGQVLAIYVAMAGMMSLQDLLRVQASLSAFVKSVSIWSVTFDMHYASYHLAFQGRSLLLRMPSFLEDLLALVFVAR